jgi:hypothetical protein
MIIGIGEEIMNEDEVLWTVKDVAAFLQVPERKIWNRLRATTNSSSGIPSVSLEGHPRFIPSHIRRWAEVFGRKLRKLTPQEEMQLWRKINPD